MSLDISQREREGVVIVDLDGRLTVGQETGALREAVLKLSTEGKTNVVLNLEKVEYIDSTGLGGLVICFTTLKKGGGALKLLNLNRRNVELLVLTKLQTVFEVFNDEQDAVNSYFPGREIKRFDILAFVQQTQSEE
ncbi:MAG TPA: STAS domain-containing protein [Bryobacteraceae bacterium]|jgi:anti-sigma B factor antagonist|nr:STAS domain-containing protein [Bryobacteraceae bacterium]